MSNKIVQIVKNKYVLTCLFIIFLLMVLGTSCGFSMVKVVRDGVEGRLDVKDLKWRWFRWCTRGLPILGDWEKLFDNKTYLVLLQNNTEIRPSGGFMGSYVRIKTNNKGIESYEVQDIYEPDGKISGHVEPPYPVQEAFGQGWWKLRDANWDADFASAAATIDWFMEQGGETRVDGIIAVNLSLLEKWIEALGSVKLATYNEVVTKDNLYGLAQKYAEVDKQKRGFLGAVGVALVEQTKRAGGRTLLNLGRLKWNELKRGEILVWFKDEELQREASKRGWAGTLTWGWDEKSDYLYLVETNLGANKANCCVEREVVSKVSTGESSINIELKIDWKNTSSWENPKPPDFWGGNYINYERIIVPRNTRINKIIVDGVELSGAREEDKIPSSLRRGLSQEAFNVETRGNLQIIGFWVKVGAGKQASAMVEMTGVNMSQEDYKVWVKKQPGLSDWKYTLEVDGIIKFEGKIDNSSWAK